MHLLIEVFTELTVTLQDFVGDVFRDEHPGLIEEFLVLGREVDAGEVHRRKPLTPRRRRGCGTAQGFPAHAPCCRRAGGR